MHVAFLHLTSMSSSPQPSRRNVLLCQEPLRERSPLISPKRTFVHLLLKLPLPLWYAECRNKTLTAPLFIVFPVLEAFDLVQSSHWIFCFSFPPAVQRLLEITFCRSTPFSCSPDNKHIHPVLAPIEFTLPHISRTLAE